MTRREGEITWADLKRRWPHGAASERCGTSPLVRRHQRRSVPPALEDPGVFFPLLANDNRARRHDTDGSETGDRECEKPNSARETGLALRSRRIEMNVATMAITIISPRRLLTIIG
jgi:hypothetical protein